MLTPSSIMIGVPRALAALSAFQDLQVTHHAPAHEGALLQVVVEHLAQETLRFRSRLGCTVILLRKRQQPRTSHRRIPAPRLRDRGAGSALEAVPVPLSGI